MKRSMTVVLSVVALVIIAGAAQAATTTWDVATVHGQNQFTISPDSTSLHYNQQGWTDYVWYQNNGSTPGTIATTTDGPLSTASVPHTHYVENRSGMRTFATSDVAAGQTLSHLKLEFEYHNTLGGYPTINFFLTDSNGKFGIFAPTSLGIGVVGVIDPISGWSKMTLDLARSDIPTTAGVAIYEHNGLSDDYVEPFTTFQWGDIKDLTIAGMYDYQRSPTNGWDAWGTSFDSTHGLALIWGDTANSSNAYGSAQREIRNVTVSFNGTDYTGSFVNATVPEPGTIVLLGTAGLGSLAYVWRRRRS